MIARSLKAFKHFVYICLINNVGWEEIAVPSCIVVEEVFKSFESNKTIYFQNIQK